MKRVLMVISVLLISLGLFASFSDSATLYVNTKVASIHQVRVLLSPTDIGNYDTATDVVSNLYLGDESGGYIGSATVYVAVKTNQAENATTLSLTLPHLKAEGVTTAIYYTATDTDTVAFVPLESQDTATAQEYRIIDGSGLRVINVPLKIALNEDNTGVPPAEGSFQRALPSDNYKATILITYTAP